MNTRQDSLTSVTERAFLMAKGFLAVSLAILRGPVAIFSQDRPLVPGNEQNRGPLSANELVVPSRLSRESMNFFFRQPVTV